MHFFYSGDGGTVRDSNRLIKEAESPLQTTAREHEHRVTCATSYLVLRPGYTRPPQSFAHATAMCIQPSMSRHSKLL